MSCRSLLYLGIDRDTNARYWQLEVCDENMSE